MPGFGGARRTIRVNAVSTQRKAAALGESRAMLRHWLEAVPNDRLAHLIRDASRGLARSLQARLAEHGVSFGHWAFLRVLWDKDGLTQRELSERVGVMESTTAVALRALEQQGHIVRKRRSENRKNLYVHLTPSGAALKARLVPLAEAVNDCAFRGIPPTHLAIVRQALLTAIRNLAEDDAALAAAERHASDAAAGPKRRRAPRLRRRSAVAEAAWHEP